ncbi:HlyD family secretion protein [Faecalibacter sp. LW9]|uniref:HlyD family secretion protein n=1 Tax=Faecalibacter sp. LW9 TaxID=3103144 RepID=UPI002B25CD31|nr:HlyD family secretion protein [Faecalibacter sp. LW9]
MGSINPNDPNKIDINLKQKVNKKQKISTICINLSVFVLVVLCFYWLVKKYYRIGDNTYTESAQIEEFINPINTRVSAYIKEIRFIEHQEVRKGDTLVVLDNREILTQLRQAEAAYKAANVSKNITNNSINTVSNTVSIAESNIAGAKARLWNAEQNLNRYKNLLEVEAISKQQFDQVKTEYDIANASYKALIGQQNTAKLTVNETEVKIGLNEADILKTKAALDMAKLNLSYTIITAPYDGVMGRRLINEGQLLQAGQQISTIVLKDSKWITANFLESQMPSIHIGTKLKMTADALGGEEFEGVVTAISAATGSKYANMPIDNSTGNFVKIQQRIPVRIEFTKVNDKNKISHLRAGMNMNIELKSN